MEPTGTPATGTTGEPTPDPAQAGEPTKSGDPSRPTVPDSADPGLASLSIFSGNKGVRSLTDAVRQGVAAMTESLQSAVLQNPVLVLLVSAFMAGAALIVLALYLLRWITG